MLGEENRVNIPRTSPTSSTDPDVGHWPHLQKAGAWSLPMETQPSGWDGVWLSSLSCVRSWSGLINRYGRAGTAGLTQPVITARVLPKGPSFQHKINQRSWPLSLLKVPCGCFGRVRMLTPESRDTGAAHPGSLPQYRTIFAFPAPSRGRQQGQPPLPHPSTSS